MDTIIKAAKELNSELTRVQNENIKLRDLLTRLFDEEEIKSCPSYELLKATYSLPISSNAEIHKEAVISDMHSIYAPRRSKPKATASVSTVPSGPSGPSGPSVPTESDSILDTECLLSDKQDPVKEVMQVEISGTVYLLHNNKFYTSDSGKYVGEIMDGLIMIDGKPFTPEERELIHVSGMYYKNNENIAYIKCNDYIARVVGEVDENNDVYAYS